MKISNRRTNSLRKRVNNKKKTLRRKIIGGKRNKLSKVRKSKTVNLRNRKSKNRKSKSLNSKNRKSKSKLNRNKKHRGGFVRAGSFVKLA